SHGRTSKTPSYTKSVSWQHHPKVRFIQQSHSDGEIITTKAEMCKVVYPPYRFPPKLGSHERIFIIYIQYDRNAQASTF
ncbi:hypothetical protein ACNAN3_23175, partial [Escherichia coli]|uniref:hypothetical protein n=1 Tax=Escherichia coli TaxID=562 RepID=UPI003F0A717F